MGSTSGRSELIDSVGVAIERVGNGLQAKSQLLIGLRGVGKTVLLDHLRVNAEDAGVETLRIEASEKKSLPSLLAPQLRQALLRLSRNEKAKDLAQRALRGSAGFAKALKVKYGDIEVGLDLEPEAGLADNGDLEHDLQALLEAAGAAAASGDKVLAIFIDELQYVPEHELAALIVALHRCAQRKCPELLVGAGLPQLRGRMGDAKSYAERLFEFPEIGPLKEEDAKAAIALPVKEQGAAIEPGALDRIHAGTKGPLLRTRVGQAFVGCGTGITDP